MNFYLITSEFNKLANELFEKACDGNPEINYIEINIDSVDIDKLPELTSNDTLYRTNSSRQARMVEVKLLNKEVTTFYNTYERAIHGGLDVATDEKIYAENDIPTPKTLFLIPKDKNFLKEKLQDFNGPPYIIKISGRSHGQGIIKSNSFDDLYNEITPLLENKEKVMIREYIPVTSSARLIVLGNKVIDSVEYNAPKDDFRSNIEKNPDVKAKKFNADIENSAIKGVNGLGLEFGGVDILIHDDKHYLIETNFPCFFTRSQQATGTDIASQMVKYLLNKQKNNAKN